MFGLWVPIELHKGRPWTDVWLLPLVLVSFSVGMLIISTDRASKDRKDRR